MTPRGPGRTRSRRGARESLTSIVLVFESIIIFLGGLAIFGLRQLPEGVPAWWAIVAGSVLAVFAIALSGFVRHEWAIMTGWVLQAVIAAGAFLVPALGLVALVFGGLYAYATIKGGELDRRNAEPAATNGE